MILIVKYTAEKCTIGDVDYATHGFIRDTGDYGIIIAT